MNLIFISMIFIIALVAIHISNKIGVTSLLLFLLLGLGLNYVGLEFEDFSFSESFSSIALMVIIFYGGFGTNWGMTKPVAKEAFLLSSAGVIVTGLLIGVFCHYALGVSWLEGMLIGSVIGSTDYASVSSILRSFNLNLNYNTGPLLELESGSNDPTAYSMTLICLTLMQGQDVSVTLTLLMQVGIGILMGLGVGYLLIKSLNFLSFDEGLLSIFIAAVSVLTFALTNQWQGNGYLAVYFLGIFIGNHEWYGKREVIFFFDGLTNIMQIAMFFLLGLLANPAAALAMLPISIAIFIFITFIARPLAVYGLLYPFRLPWNQQHIIAFAGVRGAAAIAFAILVVNSHIPLESDIYHIIFDICLLSALFQGSFLPILTRKLDMIDPSDSSLTSFNYYQAKSDIGFVQTTIKPASSIIGKRVKDVSLAFDFIVAKIIRNKQTIIPRGNVILQEDDTIILAGQEYFDTVGDDLVEFTIPHGHAWENKCLREIALPDDKLVVMIQRVDGQIVVPTGDTIIKTHDIIVKLNQPNTDKVNWFQQFRSRFYK